MRPERLILVLSTICWAIESTTSLHRDVQTTHLDGDTAASAVETESEDTTRTESDKMNDARLVERVVDFTPLIVVGTMVGPFDFLRDTIMLWTKNKRKGSTHMMQLGTEPPWVDLVKGTEKSITKYKNPEGRMPEIRTYDDFGRRAGVVKGRKGTFMRAGNVGATHVKHDGQSVYSVFGVPNYKLDPFKDRYQRQYDHQICIGWGANAMDPERGSNHYIFSGDMGAICGGYWHWSGLYVTDDGEYQPKCFWVGRYNDGMPTGFQVRWPSFSKESIESLRDPLEYCNGVDFGFRWERIPHYLNLEKHDPIQYLANSTVDPKIYEEVVNLTKIDNEGSKAGAQNNEPAQMINNTHITNNYYNITYDGPMPKRTKPVTTGKGPGSILILDHYVRNSARELCESETSYGSDYANDHERLFCEMTHKKLYYYCDDIAIGRCFDTHQQLLVAKLDDGNGKTFEKRAMREPYKKVVDWR